MSLNNFIFFVKSPREPVDEVIDQREFEFLPGGGVDESADCDRGENERDEIPKIGDQKVRGEKINREQNAVQRVPRDKFFPPVRRENQKIRDGNVADGGESIAVRDVLG